VDFHTVANPLGEARAQLNYTARSVLLSTKNTGAIGRAEVSLAGSQVCIYAPFIMTNVPVNATIHAPALEGSNAGVIVNLIEGLFDAGQNEYEIDGCFSVSQQQYVWIRDGLAYINIHTAEFPSGELRGQIETSSYSTPASRSAIKINLAAATAAFGARKAF